MSKSAEPTKRFILGRVFANQREEALQLITEEHKSPVTSLRQISADCYEYCVTLDRSTSAKQDKRRLHQLTKADISAWQKARLNKGQEKYKDAHLNRYSLVDVMEELLDAQNILALGIERITNAMRACQDSDKGYAEALFESATLWNRIGATIDAVIEFDQRLPDDVCTDDEGGSRIWWEASND